MKECSGLYGTWQHERETEELCGVWQEDVMSNRWNDEGEIKSAG